MYKQFAFCLTIVGAASLAACGGTSGSGSSAEAPTQSLTVSGVAYKGLINKGRVEVFQVEPSGGLTPVANGTATTDASGKYSISGLKVAANAVLVVQVTPQAGTTMMDEATGATITPAADFVLSGAMPAPAALAGGTQNLTMNLSPYTSVALETARSLASKNGGAITPEIVKSANVAISNATGVPVNDAPTFSDEGKPINKAAVLAASVSQMAKSGALGCTAVGQAGQIKCVVEALAKDGLTTTATVAALNAAKQEVAPGDSSTVKTAKPDATASASPVEMTRAFVANLRSNALSFDDLNSTNDLRDTVKSVQNQINASIGPIDHEISATATLISYGINFASSSGMKNPDNSCSYFTDKTFGAVSATATNFVSCSSQSSNFRWYYDDPDTRNFRYYTVLTRIGLENLSPGSFTSFAAYKDSQLISCSFSGDCTDVAGVVRADSNPFTVSASKKNNEFQSIVIKGNSVSSIDLEPLEYFSAGKYTLRKTADSYNMDIKADVTDVNSTTQRLDFSGDLSSVVSDAVSSKISVEAGSYLQATKNAAGKLTAQKGLIKLTASAGKASLKGEIEVPSVAADLSGSSVEPAQLKFTGSAALDGASFLEGSLIATADYSKYDATKYQTASNFRPTTLSFTGKMIIPNRPILDLTLNINNPALNQTTADISYTQGAIKLNATAENKPTGQTLKFSGTDGIAAEASKVSNVWKSPIDITYNGSKVATFDYPAKKVIYSDGSFEQF